MQHHGQISDHYAELSINKPNSKKDILRGSIHRKAKNRQKRIHGDKSQKQIGREGELTGRNIRCWRSSRFCTFWKLHGVNNCQNSSNRVPKTCAFIAYVNYTFKKKKKSSG